MHRLEITSIPSAAVYYMENRLFDFTSTTCFGAVDHRKFSVLNLLLNRFGGNIYLHVGYLRICRSWLGEKFRTRANCGQSQTFHGDLVVVI